MENSKDINLIGRTINGSDTEGRVQQRCFLWAWNELPETRMLLCYNLGNSKNKIDGNLNKAKGLIKGRADFTFYWNKTAYFIEMKTEIGIQTLDQKAFQRVAEKAGYEYFICRSLEEFKLIIYKIMEK